MDRVSFNQDCIGNQSFGRAAGHCRQAPYIVLTFAMVGFREEHGTIGAPAQLIDAKRAGNSSDDLRLATIQIINGQRYGVVGR